MAIVASHSINFDDFELDTRTSELRRSGVRLKLQPQPIQLLQVLLQHPGELVTREELQQQLWPTHTFVDFEHGLNTAIKKLRQALGDEAETPHYIETLPRRGYRFIGTITQETNAEPQASIELQPEIEIEPPIPLPLVFESPPVTPPIPVENEGASEPPDDRKARWMKRLAILLALCALGGVGEAVYLIIVPPPPRIVDTKQLTSTRKQKVPAYDCYLGTDGSRVYFQEHRFRDRWTLSQVSTQGGGQSDVAAPFMGLPCPQGVSPTGSEMLVKDCCPFKLWSVPLAGGSARLIPYNDVVWAAWLPDGKDFVYITVASKEWQLYRGSLDGKTKQLIASAPIIDWVRVSPDGHHLRYTVSDGAEGAPTDIWEADIDGRSPPHPVFPEMQGETWFGDWTADGKLFFFYRKGRSRGLWVARENTSPLKFTRPKPTLLYAGPLELRSPVSSKDSKELYAVGLNLRGELSVLDPASSKLVPFADGVSGCFVTFSPDHQWIAYVSYPDGALWKSRVDGSEKMQLTYDPTGVINPRWSPDGKFIVYMDWYAGPHHSIYYVSADGGKPGLLRSGSDEPADPTWMPDSNSIVYGGPGGRSLKIQMLDLSTLRSTEIPGSDWLWSPRVSPDGKFIVALSNKATNKDALVLYSFSTQRWTPLGGGNNFGFPAWSHDSKYVYAYRNAEGKFSRVNIVTGKMEVVASLDDVAWTAFRFRFSGWFDLTPNDRIMIMRDTGAEDIYSLKLEY